jgi:hypothetical protein
MLLRFAPTMLLAACCAWAQTPATKTVPVIPDTPAGHTLQAWLDALNSGDRTLIQAYFAKYEPTKSADGTVASANRTGGFELLGIDKSERLHIEFRVKEKASPNTSVGMIEVKDGNPAVVSRIILRAILPGMPAANVDWNVDSVTRSRVIDEVVAALNEIYVFPETARKMEEALRERQKKGEYDTISDGDALATVLSDQLQEVSHDQHLHVMFFPAALPKNESGQPNSDAAPQMRTQLERENCFFVKAERLPTNIGYLKLNAFADPAVCRSIATAAMNFLSNVDAIIFDLRDNGGGDPNMVAFITTYLFDKPTHLTDMFSPREDTLIESWTLPDVPGKRLTGKPVFVLTSKRTFSGAEEFSYNLKNLKRATIVGEATAGGANLVSQHRIDDHFMIAVPHAEAVNPISGTNWEGTGVEPDVKVPADQALDVAEKMAAQQLRNNQSKDK